MTLKKYYHIFSMDNDDLNRYSSNFKDAKKIAKKMEKEGYERVRIYRKIEDGDDTDEELVYSDSSSKYESW